MERNNVSHMRNHGICMGGGAMGCNKFLIVGWILLFVSIINLKPRLLPEQSQCDINSNQYSYLLEI